MRRVSLFPLGAIGCYLVLCLITGVVSASQIPLGLNGHGQVFIQEYWLAGNPNYCISNQGKKDLVIQLSRWQSRQHPSVLLTEWNAPAGTVDCHDVSEYQGEWLLEFKLNNGTRLGLLKAPKRAVGADREPPSVASYQSLNAACGAPKKMWIEQQQLWGDAGKVFSVVLQTTANHGKIEFDTIKKDGQLAVKNAISPTLPTNRDDSRIVINTNQPKKVQPYHRIELLFDMPVVSKPTMFFVAGRWQIDELGWQCFIRGVLVKP